MTAGGSDTPVAETHSKKEVQARDPGCFRCTARVRALPTTKPLMPCPSMRPNSSKFQRLVGKMSLTAGFFRSGNQLRKTELVAPLTRAESILRPLWVRITEFLRRNQVI